MPRLRCHQVWFCILVGLTFPSVGWSNNVVPEVYRSIATAEGIPPTLLYAIALTESGKQIEPAGDYRPWPWTLNLAGKGYYFDSRLEAWQALTGWIDEGKRSIDIGIMQVNWCYHQEKLGTTWQALDPYHNLRVGAAILNECYKRRKEWWSSVGCYHSPANASRADRYRQRVFSHWRRINSAG